MSLNTAATISALESHLLATGLFQRVNTHEPKNAPDTGMTASIIASTINPTQTSGLASTSAVVVYQTRIYLGMLNEPQDAIDPSMIVAVDTVLTALTADFELGGNARNIDLFGAEGQGTLNAEAGYVTVDTTMYRIMDINIPVVHNDVWPQSP